MYAGVLFKYFIKLSKPLKSKNLDQPLSLKIQADPIQTHFTRVIQDVH